jgi:hypothetical protein
MLKPFHQLNVDKRAQSVLVLTPDLDVITSKSKTCMVGVHSVHSPAALRFLASNQTNDGPIWGSPPVLIEYKTFLSNICVKHTFWIWL